MTTTSLKKRLNEAESKAKIQQGIRAEAEAREITQARLEEIMQGLESSWRSGDKANQAYIKSLTTGELLRVYRERDVWVRRAAKNITQEHMDQLAADGIGFDRMNESELQFIVDHCDEGSEGIEWDDLPLNILNKIEKDPATVDFDELRRLYPAKYSPIAEPQ